MAPVRSRLDFAPRPQKPQPHGVPHGEAAATSALAALVSCAQVAAPRSQSAAPSSGLRVLPRLVKGDAGPLGLRCHPLVIDLEDPRKTMCDRCTVGASASARFARWP
jgi:hypothetical protein